MQYVSERPATEAAFNKVRSSSILELPGTWETNGAVLGSLKDAIKYDRGISYLNKYAVMLQNLQLTNIQITAKKSDEAKQPHPGNSW